MEIPKNFNLNQQVEDVVKKMSKGVTIPQVSAATGIPNLEVEYALNSMLGVYHGRIDVTPEGILLYDFGSNLSRRNSKSIKEYAEIVLRSIWNAFVLSTKFVVSVLLIVYFVVFIVAIIVLLLVMIFGAEDSDAGDGIGDVFSGLFDGFISIFHWSSIDTGSTVKTKDEEGHVVRHYEEKKSTLAKIKEKHQPKINDHLLSKEEWEKVKAEKAYTASIYDFMFGPPRFEFSEQSNQQEVADFIQHNKGFITVTEIQALTGKSTSEAEDFLSMFIAYFGGRALISEDGVLYGYFQDMKTPSSEEPSSAVYYWEEYDAPYEWTGNAMGRNIGLLCMNLFNFVVAGLAIGMLETEFGYPEDSWLSIIAGWVPMFYSFLFFTLPIARGLFLPFQRSKRELENIRRRVYKAIFTSTKPTLTIEEIQKSVNCHSPLSTASGTKEAYEKELSIEDIKEALDRIVFDLQAEGNASDQGVFYYEFDKIAKERAVVSRLRGGDERLAY